MTIREVAGILAAAEGVTTTMSSEDSTRTTGMMDGTATAALGTTEAAPTTIEAGSSSSRSSPEDAQTGATQAEEVNSGSTDSPVINAIPYHNLPVLSILAQCTPEIHKIPRLCNAVERAEPPFMDPYRLRNCHVMHRCPAREREGSSGGQNTEQI